jgi:hypothetical protein
LAQNKLNPSDYFSKKGQDYTALLIVLKIYVSNISHLASRFIGKLFASALINEYLQIILISRFGVF